MLCVNEFEEVGGIECSANDKSTQTAFSALCTALLRSRNCRALVHLACQESLSRGLHRHPCALLRVEKTAVEACSLEERFKGFEENLLVRKSLPRITFTCRNTPKQGFRKVSLGAAGPSDSCTCTTRYAFTNLLLQTFGLTLSPFWQDCTAAKLENCIEHIPSERT